MAAKNSALSSQGILKYIKIESSYFKLVIIFHNINEQKKLLLKHLTDPKHLNKSVGIGLF